MVNCIRCNRPVYAVEEVKTRCGPVHSHCFQCNQCGAQLARGREGVHNGMIYCTSCAAELNRGPQKVTVPSNSPARSPRAGAACPPPMQYSDEVVEEEVVENDGYRLQFTPGGGKCYCCNIL